MSEDDDLSELEQRMRAKLEAMHGKPTPEDAAEKLMIAKLFGTKTQAEEFLRHEGRTTTPPQKSRIDLRRTKTFKSHKPVLVFKYWERNGDQYMHSEWFIERYENGKLIHTHSGRDWGKRDDLLIKLQASGYTCTPITVAGLAPEPIRGRTRDRRKAPSGRFAIMQQIGKLTTADLEDDD